VERETPRQVVHKVFRYSVEHETCVLRVLVSHVPQYILKLFVLRALLSHVPQYILKLCCLYNYEFGLSLCKIVRSSVVLLLPLL
jgi:hypothetical protein